MLNGAKTTRRNDTVFVALPIEAQRPIAGGCSCDWCKTHPDRTPMWDTLAVPADGKGAAQTVHFPEFR
jgi:hypothetical protein